MTGTTNTAALARVAAQTPRPRSAGVTCYVDPGVDLKSGCK